eukprot:CAMPEP_0177652708 /NCGR_PEP_ID=MMETSP0447-20121125/13285_1 /TAXON_ID=0 /ORGANISM="Stygamoeba regulata, Strain BSH-02190019" /LENGTH=436 /DNA_ID=CAMNT_0019155993 /DNA_START=345 /DNA_END=1656 /DNA_ORIENTATION=-
MVLPSGVRPVILHTLDGQVVLSPRILLLEPDNTVAGERERFRQGDGGPSSTLHCTGENPFATMSSLGNSVPLLLAFGPQFLAKKKELSRRWSCLSSQGISNLMLESLFKLRASPFSVRLCSVTIWRCLGITNIAPLFSVASLVEVHVHPYYSLHPRGLILLWRDITSSRAFPAAPALRRYVGELSLLPMLDDVLGRGVRQAGAHARAASTEGDLLPEAPDASDSTGSGSEEAEEGDDDDDDDDDDDNDDDDDDEGPFHSCSAGASDGEGAQVDEPAAGSWDGAAAGHDNRHAALDRALQGSDGADAPLEYTFAALSSASIFPWKRANWVDLSPLPEEAAVACALCGHRILVTRCYTLAPPPDGGACALSLLTSDPPLPDAVVQHPSSAEDIKRLACRNRCHGSGWLVDDLQSHLCITLFRYRVSLGADKAVMLPAS